jgi:putative ABC transport system permease protein
VTTTALSAQGGPTTGAAPAASVRDVTKTYGRGDAVVRALDGVTLDVAEGSFTAVMGPSGSGKSTLMHALAGLDTVDSGEVRLAGREISAMSEKRRTRLRRDHVGFVFQAFNLVAISVKEAMTTGVDDVVTAELVVQSGRGEMLGGLSPEVLHHASEVPGVEVASPMRFGHWRDGGATRALTAVDPATLPQVAELDMVDGSVADLDRDGIVLAEDVAAEHGVRVGDRLPMTFSRTGEQSLEVVGVFAAEDAWAMSTGYLVALGTYAEHFAEDVDATVFLGLADGADPAVVEADVRAALADFPTAEVHDQAAAAKARTRMLDSMLGLVTVLLLLAVVIALLGITNALALSIVERTREVGLLRAVGMSRRQVGLMVRLEAALTAAVGALTGVALGVVVAVAVVQALGGAADVPFTVPVGQLAAYVAVAAAGGVLAGLVPGRRAGRMDVLEAVASA